MSYRDHKDESGRPPFTHAEFAMLNRITLLLMIATAMIAIISFLTWIWSTAQLGGVDFGLQAAFFAVSAFAAVSVVNYLVRKRW